MPGLLQEGLGSSFIELNCTSESRKPEAVFVQTTESAVPLPASSRARNMEALLHYTITRNWKAAADASLGLSRHSQWHARYRRKRSRAKRKALTALGVPVDRLVIRNFWGNFGVVTKSTGQKANS
jgi:hypothetical protein